MLNINYREIDHPAAARAEHGDTIHEEIRDTQLVDYEHILIVNTATTPAGKLVSTLAGYSKATNEHQLRIG